MNVDIAFVGEMDANKRSIRSLATWVDGGQAENIEYELAGTPYEQAIQGGVLVVDHGLRDRFPQDALLRSLRVDGCVAAALRGSDGAAIGAIVLLKRGPFHNAELGGMVLKALVPRAAAELERQIADRRLRDSERRFRSVLDHLPIAVHIKVGDTFALVNRKFSEQFGIPVAELEGTTSSQLHARMGWPENIRPGVLEVQDEVRRTGRIVVKERHVRFVDGKMHEMLVATFPITNEAGEVAAIGIAATDLTHVRRVEHSLAQAQKMDALGRLAGGIAHDFNNIVGAIAGFARFIVEDTPDGAPTRRHAERIVGAAARAQKLVEQILAFSRRRDLNRQRVPAAGILDELSGLLRATLPRSTRFEVSAPPSQVAIAVDSTQLIQVLVNICVNANDALKGETGSIRLLVRECAGEDAAADLEKALKVRELPEGQLCLAVGKVDRSKRYLRLSVSDTGHGMSRETLEQIFDPFFTTKGQGKGTGLGLPVVHGVVLDHDGAIIVTTREGGGTIFEVLLPVAPDAVDAPLDVGPRETRTGSGRILLVDDDDDFADMLTAGLERLGYEVAIANHPEQALSAFREDPDLWDLVITDHTMPDMTGLEMIRRIREDRADIGCILCTGYGHPMTIDTSAAAGADAHLSKPVDLAELGSLVERLVRRRAPISH